MDIDLEHPAAVPITVITGFLGAGKTTLLNRILNGSHGLKVAVLVNDFGAVNIDAELVVGVESSVVSLANGCICCTIRDDLLETVMETVARPERPEYILLEASGVAEPSGIALTFNNPSIRDRIRLDGIVCVVDAEQVFAAPETMELKLFQIACADMLVLNKVDLVDSDQVDRIKQWLDSRFHRYRLIETCRCNVPLGVLLSVGRFNPTHMMHDSTHHCNSGTSLDHQHLDRGHSTVFGTWSYETDRPLLLPALHDAVSKLPASIYRAKGLIYAAEAPQRRAVLQAVGRRVNITIEDEWGQRTPRTQIVLIGVPNQIDTEALRELMDRCLAPAPSPAETFQF